MSLFDTDKNSEDRGSPMPNSSDVLSDGAVKAHKTISSHYSSDADTSNTRLQMQNKQLIGNNGTSQIVNYGVQSDGNFALKFFDANGIGVARFGQYADGSIALKVAKSGQEVDTASGNNLIFNSAQDSFKIVQSGTATQTGNNPLNAGATQTVTIAHNLGFTPAFQVYVNAPAIIGINGGNGLTNLPVLYAINAGVGLWLQARADSSNLYLDITNVGATNINYSATTWTYRYYLLQETAT